MTTNRWAPDPATEKKLRAAGWVRADEVDARPDAGGVSLVLEALDFLATARAAYVHSPEPVPGESESDRLLRVQVQTTRQLHDMLAGTHPSWGWLPTWFGHLWEPIFAALQSQDVAGWENVLINRGMVKGIREAVVTVCGPTQPYGDHLTYCVPLLALAGRIAADEWVPAEQVDSPVAEVLTVEMQVAAGIADGLGAVDADAQNHVRVSFGLPGAVHYDN